MGKKKSPETYTIAANNEAPNSRLPVLVYREALDRDATGKAKIFEKYYSANGWGGAWEDTIYTYRHFHTNAHEALGIAEGTVTLEIGGKTGKILELAAGDLIILPAGIAHKRLSKEKILVVGAYPKGQHDYDICRSLDRCSRAAAEIGDVPLPAADPFYGKQGALTRLWKLPERP